MKLTENEINVMLGKSQDVRYNYSLKRIADRDCLCVLTTNGEHFLSILDKGQNIFPIWPFKEYAEKYILTLDENESYATIDLSL